MSNELFNLPPLPAYRSTTRCEIPGCSKPVQRGYWYARNRLCSMHAARKRLRGHPLARICRGRELQPREREVERWLRQAKNPKKLVEGLTACWERLREVANEMRVTRAPWILSGPLQHAGEDLLNLCTDQTITVERVGCRLGGLHLIRLRQPNRWHDEVEFRINCLTQVRNLSKLVQTSWWRAERNRAETTKWKLRSRARPLAGQAVVLAFAPWLVWIEKEERRRQALTVEARACFNEE